MTDNPILTQALSLALTLSPKERLHLITQVASSVEHDFIEPIPLNTAHWGEMADAILDQIDTSAWEAIEMTDPTTWLKEQREDERKHRLADWGDSE